MTLLGARPEPLRDSPETRFLSFLAGRVTLRVLTPLAGCGDRNPKRLKEDKVVERSFCLRRLYERPGKTRSLPFAPKTLPNYVGIGQIR